MAKVRDVTPVDRSVGLKIKLYRKQAGLSQTALAQAIGVTYQQVQKYESGFDRISVGRLHGIAKATRMPIASFFEDGEVEQANKADSTALAQCAKSLAAMPPHGRHMAVEVLRAIERACREQDAPADAA